MSIQVQARIKGLEEYTWLTYNGAPLKLSYKNKPFTVTRGDIFGVRPGTNGAKRVVFARPDLGMTRVLTLRSDLEAILSKSFAKLAPTLKQVEFALTEEELPPPAAKFAVFQYEVKMDNGKFYPRHTIVPSAEADNELARLVNTPKIRKIERVE